MNYNKYDPKDIERYAKLLIGKTFSQITDKGTEDYDTYFANNRKGGLGNYIEEIYFGYKANGLSEADFKEAGIELKMSPYEINKDGSLRAGERLVLSMIPNNEPLEDDLFASHLWEKCKLILMIFYWRNRLIDKRDYMINYVNLFTPSEDDLKIIEEDYRKIVSKIKAGLAHELSEGDTLYLGACTKGATAAKSLAKQYYNPDVPAKRRAFSFKQSYMTYVLNTYFAHQEEDDESIIQSAATVRKDLTDAYAKGEITFEELICRIINSYKGKTDKELCAQFDLPYENRKAQWITLAYKMLGIASNRAKEFKKANIVVKAIRIQKNNAMREHSPLPPISFQDFIDETWEDSSLLDYLENTKFLFVVFKEEGDNYILKGAKLWHMPQEDIEIAREGWQDIQDTFRGGIRLIPQLLSNGKYRMNNNIPATNNNSVIHMRPHASQAFYLFEDGSTYGPGKLSDSDLLPDGRRMTKQSFWINNTYLVKQIKDLLTEP